MTPTIPHREHQQRQRADPELGPEQRSHRQRARLEQPERAPFDAHGREDEARGDRREHEAGEPEIQKRNRVHEEGRDPRAAQRQELHVEDVHDHEHREQNQLRPLRRVAEEDAQLLHHELAPQDPERLEQEVPGASRDPPPHPTLRTLLRLREARRVELLMQQCTHHERRTGRRPQQIEREPVRLPLERRHDRALHPLARQIRRGRRAQERDEVDERLQSLGARELFGTHEAEQQHDAGGRHHGDDAEDVLRASRGKRVHENDHDRRAGDSGDDQKGHKRRDRDERKHQPAPIHPAIRREDRHGHQRDHPAGVQHRLRELGRVERQPVHGRRHEQLEIFCEKEGRQCGNDVREQQDHEEADEHQPEHLSREQRSDLRRVAEHREHARQHEEHEAPEQQSDRGDERPAPAVTPLAGARRAAHRGEHLRSQQMVVARIRLFPALRGIRRSLDHRDDRLPSRRATRSRHLGARTSRAGGALRHREPRPARAPRSRR